MANAPMNKVKAAKGSGRAGVKRSKGSAHVPNGVGVPQPATNGPMGVSPAGGGMIAPPMLTPKTNGAY